LQQLNKENGTELNPLKLRPFIEEYHGSPEGVDSLSSLQNTVDGFREIFKEELNRFKGARDKRIAHSEYDVDISSLPSYDTMEKLFLFGADFYDLVSSVFGDVSPIPIKEERRVKVSLIRLFQQMGIKEIREDME
jgi:hypothetical protein